MSLSKISLKFSLWLAAATLALTLAGCGLNPFAKDDEPVYTPPPVETSGTPSAAPRSAEPAPYQPRMERINEPVPLAEGSPNECGCRVGDTLW